MEGADNRKIMDIGEYEEILPKILEKIAAAGQEKYLPENTPIFMQWIVKDLELLEPSRHPLPNTYSTKHTGELIERFPYQQRLYNWAKREPGRLICLFYVGSGLSGAQTQHMEDLEKLSPNIRIIDFNTLDLKEFDFNFKHPTLGETNISNYYKNLYSIPKDQRINFGSEIDLIRVLILLKAGEALIESGKAKPEEIPESKAVIYFDFDVQPNKEGKKIGKVKIPADILISHSNKEVENAIMAVSGPNNFVLQDIARKSIGGDNHGHGIHIFTQSALTRFVINNYLTDENILDVKYDDESKKGLAEVILCYYPGCIDVCDIDIFGFEYNSNSPDFQYDHELEYPKKNVMVNFDRSWKNENVYKSEDLPINPDPTTSLNQTMTKEITDGNKSIR